MRLGWRSFVRVCSLVALGCSLASSVMAGEAGGQLEKIRESKTLRVCIWPDYYGLSFRNPKSGTLSGLDTDMAREFARELSVSLRFVDTTFGRFIEDLDADRCDIAMMGVAVTPQRAERLALSRPYLRGDVYAVTTRHNTRVRSWQDIDRPGTRVAVLAGTYHEPLMRERLQQAELVVVVPPRTREAELESGRVDVFMSDFPFTRKMRDHNDWVRVFAPPAPYFLVNSAYAVKRGDAAWLQRVDAFVAAIRADGRLLEAARRYGLDPMMIKD